MPQFDFKSIKNQAEKEIKKAENLTELEGIFKKYLGKQGELTQVLRSLEKLSKEKRAKIGKEANELKKFLKLLFEQKTQAFKEKVKKETEESEWLDVTLPGKKPVFGHLHPLTLARRRMEEIFQSMGFSIVEGPEMETEWYNFDALNIPKNHPARDIWDTFYLKTELSRSENEGEDEATASSPTELSRSENEGEDEATASSPTELPKEAKVKMKTKFSSPGGLLLRTHTSPMQVRYMEKNQPPLRIIVPGNVFRHEATDYRHEFQLFQVEGLMVDREISVPSFKAIIGEFFRRFFKKEVEFRLKPDFFPFTEPSFDISMTCLVCAGKGCSACKNTGWMEVAGAGMVHPNVFKNSGLNPKEWRGWAFGFGLDRLAMMKYKINDIRLLRSGDLRFLHQF